MAQGPPCPDTDGSRGGEGARVSTWGHPAPVPAPSIMLSSCYNIHCLDCEAPMHLYHCSGDQGHQSGNREGPNWGIRKRLLEFLMPPGASEVNEDQSTDGVFLASRSIGSSSSGPWVWGLRDNSPVESWRDLTWPLCLSLTPRSLLSWMWCHSPLLTTSHSWRHLQSRTFL